MDLEPTDAPPQTGQRARRKRSRFGCHTCRSRKVKCDERPNGCANCEKLHLECSGYDPRPSRRQTPARRTFRSCTGCRVARTKCSGDRPTCIRCRDNSTQCSYEDVRDRTSTVSSSHLPDAEPVSDPLQAAPGSANDSRRLRGRETVQDSTETSLEAQLAWLQSTELPEPKQIRLLVTYYFQNFHPLRCFAFIHKPSFLRRLDERIHSDLREDALLHIMCTIGAQFFALEYSDTVQGLRSAFILHAGSRWAASAQRLVMNTTDVISVDGLMTAQLLYDYALRMANFTQAFILSALMARMTQALQINLEYSGDVLNQASDAVLSVTTREERRRLMWSCYVTDVLVGSGVDQLTLIHEKDIKIQLPCNEWGFLHERPSITRTINGAPLSFVPPELIPADLDANMGILGYFIQQTEMRRRVLRYIKHLDKAKLPWQHDSEFALLDAELRSWYESLPENLELTTSTMYMRQESSQLGALCLFHCAYHQTMCDLYRIGTPVLYKLRGAFRFPSEKSNFQRQLRWALFREARTLAAIIAQALRHGPRIVGDTWLPTIAYDSNRIMLFYLTQISDTTGTSKRELVLRTIPYLQSNVRALKAMSAMNVVADGLSRAAESMLEKLGVDSNNILPLPQVILEDPYLALMDRSQHTNPGTPPQSAPDYVLNPLSIFRMARSRIPEGHSPESTPSYSHPMNRPQQQHTTHAVSSDNTSTMERLVMNTAEENQDLYGAMDEFAPNLDMFFASDAELDWQSAELVVGSGMHGDGLLPWIGTSQLGEFVFDPPQQ